MEKKLETTALIQEANEIVLRLSAALPSVLSRPIWKHRIPIEEKITFLKELASARRTLWQVSQKAYPELNGKIYTVNSSYVSYEDETTSADVGS